MRNLVWILIGCGVLAAVGYALWPKPVLVDLTTVSTGPMQVTVDEEGKTRIKERYKVSAPLSGQLRRIELDPGDPVQAGVTLLAVIEPSDPDLLDARSRAEARARVKAAEAVMQQATPNLERARASLEFAQAEHGRVRTLFEQENATQQQLERAELDVRTKVEEHKAAQFAVQIATFELEQAQAVLLRSEPNASGTTDGVTESPRFDILSPISGCVLHVLEQSAAVVQAGTRLVELGDPADLEVEVDVLSSDGVLIERGSPVVFDHWGGEAPLHGRVRLVEPAAFTKISALGVEEQRVYVVADFDEPPEQRVSLGDGFRVEARIVTWRSDNVLRVPAGALFRHEEKWAVFRLEDGRARLRHVEIGHLNAQEAELLGGLATGDQLVAHPSDKVEDNVRIEQR